MGLLARIVSISVSARRALRCGRCRCGGSPHRTRLAEQRHQWVPPERCRAHTQPPGSHGRKHEKSSDSYVYSIELAKQGHTS